MTRTDEVLTETLRRFLGDCNRNGLDVGPAGLDLIKVVHALSPATSRLAPPASGEGASGGDDRFTPRWLTVKQIAEDVLQLGERTVERLVADGDLKAVRVGRSLRIDSRDLVEFMDRIRDTRERQDARPT